MNLQEHHLQAANDAEQVATVAGESLRLTAGRAIIWAARKALIVADLHIGKAAAFRALGTPVPRGTTGDTLGRLGAAIDAHGLERMFVLGDFLHARRSLPAATIARLRAWRERYRSLEIVLVNGNHDRHAGPPPPELRIEVHDEFALGPFVLAHYPAPSARGYVLAGHLHPAIAMHDRFDSLRLPCYWLQRDVAVLPAFGAFTGGYEIAPGPRDRVYVVAGERVFALPAVRSGT